MTETSKWTFWITQCDKSIKGYEDLDRRDSSGGQEALMKKLEFQMGAEGSSRGPPVAWSRLGGCRGQHRQRNKDPGWGLSVVCEKIGGK